jgi:hypothetical protein
MGPRKPVSRLGRTAKRSPIQGRTATVQAEDCKGVRATWSSATLIASPPGPELALRDDRRGGRSIFLYAISDVAPGTTCGNHRAHFPRHLRTSPGMVFAVRVHEPPLKAEHDPELISSYKRRAGGSNPPAPTKFLQLGGIFETLIGDPVTTAGNHRCMLPDGGRVPSGHGRIPFDHQGAPCADGRHYRH